MNTVIDTTLARLPPARLSIASICEKTCFTCASKLLAISLFWLSRVAVWPATHTILPPSVITPGEKARESWNGVFSMYSAADAQSGRARKSASRRSMMIPPLSINAYGSATLGVDRRAVHPLAVEGHDDVTAGIDGDEAAIALQARQVRYRSVSGFLER